MPLHVAVLFAGLLSSICGMLVVIVFSGRVSIAFFEPVLLLGIIGTVLRGDDPTPALLYGTFLIAVGVLCGVLLAFMTRFGVSTKRSFLAGLVAGAGLSLAGLPRQLMSGGVTGALYHIGVSPVLILICGVLSLLAYTLMKRLASKHSEEASRVS